MDAPGFLRKDLVCEVRLVRMPSGSHRLVRGSIADISDRKRMDTGGGRRAPGLRAADEQCLLEEVLASIAG